MKLLYVITGLHRGGAEGQLLEVVTRMQRRGHQVEVVSALPASGYAEDIRALGIPVHSLEIPLGRLSPRALPRLARIIWRFRPDVVHSFMVHSNLLTRVVRPAAPKHALVNTALGISESRTPDDSSRPRELAYTATDWLSDATTQVSRKCADHYVRLRAVPSRKMKVIPVGVDPSRFVRFSDEKRRECRKTFSVPDEGFNWVSVARFTPDKDHKSLLEAFAIVHRQAPQVRLFLKGLGALEGDLRQRAKASGLGESVRFVTERVQMEHFLNAFDGSVLSSVREGMPTVLLEAAACELPTVATDVGGNAEVTLDGRNGFVVPASKPERLAEAMLKVMSLTPAERTAMGRAGRQHIIAAYDLEHVTSEYEALYRQLSNSAAAI